MDNLILVNKTHPIDVDFVPEDLELCNVEINGYRQYKAKIIREACINYWKMKKDALLKNYDLYVCSGFRSGLEQQKTFNSFLKRYKKEISEKNPFFSEEEIIKEAYEKTIKRVALPGQSEHHTGLAIDIECYFKRNYDEDIADKREVDWMKENAYKYGYILRYPEGKEDITGYRFEPWHYRYIGEEYATDFIKKDMTFEEYHKLILKK